MNYMRILLGGLLAGVVINLSEFLLWGVLLREQNEAMLMANGLTEASWAMPAYVVSGFALGILLAWVYAAIRPRFGAGWKTAAIGGAAIWVAAWVMPAIWIGAMGLGMGMSTTVLSLVWGLVEFAVAGAAAGYVYQEAGATATASAPSGM
jgi:hypothetical protein